MTIRQVLKFDSSNDVKLLDARGPRFGAVLTTLVLAAILACASLPLLIWQLGVFALGAFVGPQATPYAWIYRALIKPRLRGDVPTEDTRPPQFAQVVGFLFALTATIALALDATLVFEIATGFALAAATRSILDLLIKLIKSARSSKLMIFSFGILAPASARRAIS